MPSRGPNRLKYVFPAVAFTAALLYYLYGAVDRLGLETRQTKARVMEKQFAPGSTTYNTRIAGGRAWTQATENPDLRLVVLEVEGEATGGTVDLQTYESLEKGDLVRVSYQRTRLSNQVLVTGVRR
jgi:hypothetical protein